MHTRELNILALPEPTKNAFLARLDEIGGILHRRLDKLIVARADAFDMALVHGKLGRWDKSVFDFERGIDMNFGEWQDRMEILYNDIIHDLEELEKSSRMKGGDKS